MNSEELDQIIEKSFSAQPDFHLPSDFAQKITSLVVRRNQWINDLYEYLYLISVIIALLSVVGGLYYYTDKELVLKFLAFVSENIIQVAFTVFLLNFILFTDRVLLRLLFSRWSRT
jgi:hypothetical protein